MLNRVSGSSLHPMLLSSQAPFYKFYTPQEKATYYDVASPVGNVFPNPYIFGYLRNPIHVGHQEKEP